MKRGGGEKKEKGGEGEGWGGVEWGGQAGGKGGG